MNVAKIAFLAGIKPLKYGNITFCAANPISADSFEKSKTKKVAIKDLSNIPIEAVIKEVIPQDTKEIKGKNPKKFIIEVNDKELGYATVSELEDELFLDELSTQENFERNYKGAGTQLLKCAVRESKQRGFNGRLRLKAFHQPEPFVFYYKNNFVIKGGLKHYNAALDYAAKNNLTIEDVIPEYITTLTMGLDEKSADAFLNNKRLYKTRNVLKICEKTINAQKYQVNLVPSPDSDEYYFQIINNDAKELKQCFIARTKTVEYGNKKYLELFNVEKPCLPKGIEQYAQEAAKICAQKLGLDNAVITDNYFY